MAHTGRPPGGGGRTRLDVGEIFARFGQRFREQCRPSALQAKVMGAIAKCRTAALGGHSYACDTCGYMESSYNSCRNRHCPKCQKGAQYRWVEAQQKRLLNTHYFHVVFTLPAELRPLAASKPELVYALLMRSAAESLLAMGLDPRHLGGLVGITAVLHTWSRALSFHPHVHCIVTGGGLSPVEGRWRAARQDRLFPIRPLQALFRGKFLAGIKHASDKGQLKLGPHRSHLLGTLYRTRWHVYVKAPFAGVSQVFRYLGAYTHRVGIANSRLREVSEDKITFVTRGEHTVTLRPVEFIRRFLLHTLPKGFVKIRHYGLFASAHASSKHARAAECLGPVPSCDDDYTEEDQQDQEATEPSVLASGPAVIMLAILGRFPCPQCASGLLVRLDGGGPDPP